MERELAPPSTARMWATIAPTVVFLLVNWAFGVVAAAIAATLCAVGVIVWRAVHHTRIGWVLPISLGYVVVRGAISAATRSEDAYFGIGLAVSAGFALVVLGSAFTSRPFAIYAIPLAFRYDRDVRLHPRYRSVAAHISVAWAVADLAVTAWEAWHLRSVGPVEFVGRRTLIGWPVMAFVVFWLIFYIRFRLDPLAHALRVSGEAGPPASRE